MTEILTVSEMRALEARAMMCGACTGEELMERAGQGVAKVIAAHWPELAPEKRRAVVLCGPGNNGGDGFVIARVLASAGWQVEVHFYGTPDRLPPDAALNYARWQAVHPVWKLSVASIDRARQRAGSAVFIDALFGIGLKRAFVGELAEIVACLAENVGNYDDCQLRMVAVDVPSGLAADSGRILGGVATDLRKASAIHAALTVTFDSPKPGHFLADGPDLCGKLVVCDIGLGKLRAVAEPGDARKTCLRLRPALPEVSEPRSGEGPTPARLRKAGGHKFDHGAVLVLSGGVGRGGAARLAARAALRVGAGLVTLGCPPAALIENAAQLNAIMLARIKDGAALGDLLEEDSRFNALALGPGLGTDARAAGLVRVTLEARRPCVLDADALTLIARDIDLKARLHDGCVLTPHGGEFARLVPQIAARLDQPKAPDADQRVSSNDATDPAAVHGTGKAQTLQHGAFYSKVDAVRDAAGELGCTVLFKGPDTVVADPFGAAVLCHARYDRAAPWLATAGAGDTLTGIITGMLARRMRGFESAELAAHLHQDCALSFGPGLIAEDIPDEIPSVLRRWGL